MATTIVLADDHAVVRSGLKLLLEGEEDFEVVALAGTADDALRYVRGHKPDVLILDLNMPGARKSLDVIPEVEAASPVTRVVVLTMQEDPAFARQALRAGALGYVLKEAADDELVNAVRLAGEGRARRRPRGAARRPDRARGRRAPPDRAGSHQQRDRRAAAPLGPHGRDAPRAHPAEAAPVGASRARALRPRTRAREGAAVPVAATCSRASSSAEATIPCNSDGEADAAQK